MIRAEASIDVPRTKADVFAFVDDFARMPSWHSLCVGIEQTSPPPRRVGSTVHYTFKQGGRAHTLDGRITAYEPGRRLTMAFDDKAFRIGVDFDIRTEGAATRLTHVVGIEPLGFASKLMTPLIRVATQKQVSHDMEALKELLSAPAR